MTTPSIEVPDPAGSCALDRTCSPQAGCGCGAPNPAPTRSTRGSGAKAAIVAALCAVACLVVPLVVGGLAAVTGALAGEWLIVAGSVLVTAVVSVVMLRRGAARRAVRHNRP